jgi:hypothetical protein
MSAILHKVCEKAEQELWEILKHPDWSKEHAEVAFYMVEIMKGVKKMEHLKKLDEAMGEYSPSWEKSEYEMKDEEEEEGMGEFARRGGRGRAMRTRYTWNEPPQPPVVYNFATNGTSGGNDGGGPNGNYAAKNYYEEKYKELLEEKWEREKKEKEMKK